MTGCTPRAPVVLFAFRRADHLRRTLDALERNTGASDTDLIVFADSPRDLRDAPAVAQVRELLGRVEGFRSLRVVERGTNFGLGRNLVEGVTETLAQHDAVIVLEDDMVTSPHFLDYMRDGLRRYANDERVVSISGYQLPLSGSLPETYFLCGTDCWGWATWRRGWRTFERDGAVLLAELERRELCRAFDLGGAYPYTSLLRQTTSGLVDSWAVRWHASAFLQGLLTLCPGRSLVQNIGNDGTGTHPGVTGMFDVSLAEAPLTVAEIPVVDDAHVRARLREFFVRQSGLRSKLGRLLRSSVARLVARGA